jgi:hypothetical protein
MAAVETNVLDAHDGYVTKVEAAVDGARRTYELTHKPAQVGDLVRSKADCCFIKAGEFYVNKYNGAIGYGVGGIGVVGYGNAEVFAKVQPAAPRLHVGQLAKVVSAENFDIGDTVRIVEDDGSDVPYKAERLSDGYTDWGRVCRFSSYTPQAGDELTVSGVDYVLRDRKAQVGEKIISLESQYIGDVRESTDIYTTFGFDRAQFHGKYLVLSPKACVQPANFTWINAAESETEDEGEDEAESAETRTLIIREKDGLQHEVESEVTADHFIMNYGDFDDEFIEHPALWIRVADIASITAKGAN